jgi:hypothetical protein
MSRWGYIKEHLKSMSLKERKALFSQFMVEHDRWAKKTLEVLAKVVVLLQPQHKVAELTDTHKQSLNRSVKRYKEFLNRRGIK